MVSKQKILLAFILLLLMGGVIGYSIGEKVSVVRLDDHYEGIKEVLIEECVLWKNTPLDTGQPLANNLNISIVKDVIR